MLWGIEFQVLTPWYKKDCYSFALFINGIGKHERRETAGRMGMSDIVFCEVLV